MINQELLDYIKNRLQQGMSKEQIKSSLLDKGWQAQDIDKALSLDLFQSANFYQETSKGKKKLSLIILITAIILIIIGGVFGYFYYFKETPEKIVQKMIVKMTEVKSLEFSGEIITEVDAADLLGDGGFLSPTQAKDDKKKGIFSIGLSGKFDVQKSDDQKGLFLFSVKTDVLPQGGELALGLEIRIVNRIFYIRISNVPNLGLFDLSVIENKWVKIDLSDAKRQFGSGKVEEVRRKISPEQIRRVKAAVQKAKIIKITDKLSDEKIDGVDAYHYKFIADEEGIKELLINIYQIIQDKPLTETEIAKIDEGFEAIEESENEIWIGKKDLLPRKVYLTSVVKETDKLKTSGKGDFILLLKNFNEPMQIEAPSRAVPLEEILRGLFGGFVPQQK